MKGERHVHETLRQVDGGSNVDFDKRKEELREVEKKFENSDFLPKEKIDNMVESIKGREQSYLVMRQILERLRDETNYLHEWIEMGFFEKILEDELGDQVEDVRTFWGSNEPKPKYKGLFRGMGKLKLAFVVYEKPEAADIIKEMATTGFLPKSLRVMGHERVHGYQIPATGTEVFKSIIEAFLGGNKRSQELKEAHANRSANNPPHKKTPEELKEKINPKKYKGVQDDRLDYAISAIDKLNALGLTPEEIGKIIMHHGGWDKQSGVYVAVARKIKELQNQKLMTDDDLKKLVETDKIERNIERLKAMLIAQEVIRINTRDITT